MIADVGRRLWCFFADPGFRLQVTARDFNTCCMGRACFEIGTSGIVKHLQAQHRLPRMHINEKPKKDNASTNKSAGMVILEAVFSVF